MKKRSSKPSFWVAWIKSFDFRFLAAAGKSQMPKNRLWTRRPRTAVSSFPPTWLNSETPDQSARLPWDKMPWGIRQSSR